MSAKIFAWISISWLTFAFSDWVINNLVGTTSDIDVIFSFELVQAKEFLGVTFPIPNFDYFTSLWNLAAWNFWFFETDPTFWVRFFFGVPTIGIMIFYLYNNLLPVFINFAGAAGNIVRAVNPLSFLRGR